ncbi:MAG: LamG-like jellyroll fold domain-containing protein, partial [Anaerolineae bacterium]
MSNKSISRIAWTSLVGVFLLLLGLLAYRQASGQSASAAGQVEQAWKAMRLSDSYAFSGDTVITTIPLPTVGNIGRFSRTDSLYLEGSNDLRRDTTQLALWGGAVSAADPSAAYQIRIKDGKTETRAGDGDWQASDSADLAFAPEGDFLAFLDFARDIAYAGEETVGEQQVAKYSFAIDGPAYADRLRQLTQERLVAEGTLPRGVAMEAPEHIAQMTGQGELWIDARGLPLREVVRLQIPAAPGADYRTEAELSIHFTNVAGGQLARGWSQTLASASLALRRMDLPSPGEAAAYAGLLALTLTLALLVARPNRRIVRAVHIAIVAIMIAGPIAQTGVVKAEGEQIAAYQAQVEQAAAETASAGSNLSPSAAPVQPLTPLESLDLQRDAPDSSVDSDDDGLTDVQEDLIGTNPYSPDSDFDGVSDYVEVTGFLYNGSRWYGNPLWADSNTDGVIDSQEWNPAAPDSDGDGVPDLHDLDDDGDGVPDNLDVSRLVASKDNAGNLITFSQANPLQLAIDGLQANRYTYVNVQLRPTNPDHLWYAFNVMNWPRDEKGNMQDRDNKTFFDYCVITGGSNCNMTPDANGDIKLVPMLEVQLNDLSSLPRTSGGALDTQLLAKYGINVQPAGNGGYYLYVPLNLVEDKASGAKVAFNAQLLYQAGAAWQPQQVRLSWAVQVLREQELVPGTTTTVTAGLYPSEITILHAYYSDFYLTGLNVREDRGVQMAIVYEDPATDTDVSEHDALTHMMNGLGNSYLINRDCDLTNNDGDCIGNGQRDITIPVIKQRWDRLSNGGTTAGQRWGIAQDRLRVETYNFAHEDEATMIGGGTYAPAILNSHFSGHATKTALLFVREARFRASNMDARVAGDGGIAWSGPNVRINFAGNNELITGGFNLAPYKYVSASAGWTRQTPQEFVQAIEERYPLTNAGRNTTPIVTTGQQTAVVISQITGVQGENTVLSQNGQAGLAAALTSGGAIRLKAADIRDEDLRRIYAQALASGISPVPYLAKNAMVKGLGLSNDAWETLVEQIFERGAKLYAGKEARFAWDAKGLDDFKSWLRNADSLGGLGRADNIADVNKIGRFRQALVGPMLAGMAVGFLLTNVKGGETAGQVMLSTLTALNDTIDAISTYRVITSNMRGLGVVNPGVIMEAALRHSFSFTSTVAKAAAVGAVIGVVATWAFFFAAWGKGGLSTDSIAFNSLLAGAIAATLMIVVTFLLSLSVVGAIILAVFAVFDLIALIICKAGVKLACSLGITEAITKVITEWIYTGGLMIDTQADPSLTNIEDAKMRLTYPERGLVVGNSVRFDIELFTLARHLAPEPGVVYHYADFFTPADLRSTTVKYSLDTIERKLPAELNQTYWPYVESYGWVEAEVPSPVVGWLVPTTQSKTLYQGARTDRLVSGVYQFSSAQINQTFPLYLNTGMALPRYDCWFQVCKHKSAKSTVSTDLGKQFVLDILPATLTEFVNWSQLGVQIDRDGDGVLRTLDPNDTKADSDGDGLPDGAELKRGSDPLVADADGDGLNDALELRCGTNPAKADSDGDGISDYDEVKGYVLTYGGVTVNVVSDPTLRDTDSDGISDGAERRLNLLNPALYPFNPGTVNVPPVVISSELADIDRVLAVGATTTLTATVINGTAVADALVAAGSFNATLPAQLGGATQSRNFTLLPTASAAIVLNGVAAMANGTFNATSSVAADLVAVPGVPSAPFDDIIYDDALPVAIDNDPPNAPALTLGQFVQPGNTVIIGGVASDPTSYIAQVDVSVAGGPFSAVAGTSLWAFPVDIPNQPSGAVPIVVRATDAVGYTNSANFNLTIDSVSPNVAVDLAAGALRRVRRNADGAWSLRLSGTATDALAGMESLSIQVGTSANVVITPTGSLATGIALDGSWLLDYPFDDPAFNLDPRPTGPITLTITARDNALPDGNPTTQIIPFVLDMTPPVVALLSHEDERLLTDGAVITGTVSDAHAAVASVEYAFVDAKTVLAVESTLLNLPLNDLPETVLFANLANDPARIFCLDESCPTSGVDGEDGTAALFDGVDDLLRSFDPLDLPESGLTTSLWFRTTCANCGLFSATQGVYPAIAEHDRDLFLDAGKVCSSTLVGALREVRCTAAGGYADNQWHQVVHSLGASGNALYVDGQLAASSPTSASTFTSQNGVLIGRAPAAASPFFNGRLDNVVIYDGALAAPAVASLYRQWRPATLTNGGSQWSFTVPQGIEGTYQIDMRAADSLGNRVESRGDWPQFRGPVDTQFPAFDLAASYRGSGSAAQTIYSADVRDYNLTTENYEFVCPLALDQLRYNTDAMDLGLSNQPSDKLAGIVTQCLAAGFQTSLVAASACDTVGHCGAATPPQTVAYLGTTDNRVQPWGSLPNAIERANLSDPAKRERLIERPGRVILDIAVDESHGKVYWAEMLQGDYAQPAGVWRANLDGSGVQQVVSGLTAYGAEALQIAIDPAGNKLYYTKGHELWWANLDGTLPQLIYSIDGAVVGVSQIGDVVVDRPAGRLYFSERRRHGTLADFNAAQAANVAYIPFHGRKHTLIVTTNLNGASPEIFAGVGPGCTYANFYANQGTGVGAGTQPTTCLISGANGFDVEALAVSGGTVYWSAIDNDGVSSGVYGRTPGQPVFSVAPLDMPGNSNGLRSTPLPQLHVDGDSLGVFVMHGTDIVRGERGGEFTVFTSFVDNTPAAPGNVRRSRSTLSAMAVTKAPQETQTDTDLAVGITSPNLVIIDGQTARYDISLRNDAALAAADTVLTLTMPNGASFAGASRTCTPGGLTVTCDLGRFPALSRQSVAISVTVSTATVRDLAATVVVASSTAERTPANNVATHGRITAAPTLAALPGIPYIYYGDLSRLNRVPLFGDYTAEPLFLDPAVSGNVIAADAARNRLFIITGQDRLIAVNPDGSGRLELADTNAVGLSTDGRNRVAVDEATGRIYWSEIKTLYLTDIKSANPNGSDVQTVVSNVRNQRGLLVDPVRRKLLWVGADTWLRQELIFSSNLDGSGLEVVYAAPEGTPIRELSLDPYSQKLYWLDPTFDDGALFWADSDGGRLAALATDLGREARGLVVRPYENALYYVSYSSLIRSGLDGSNANTLADLSQRAYTGLMLPVNPVSFSPTWINRPQGNLAFVIAAPFGAPPCVVNDGFEPNNSAAAAQAVAVGNTNGALCITDAALPQDIDFFKITVPDGKQLDLNLGNLPADYGLYVQRAGLTLATSLNAGLANETISLPNYDGNGEYIIAVFSSTPVNNPSPYTLSVALNDAPPHITNAQCLAVDPNDLVGAAGNQTQANATPLTVGTPATGALCFQDDVDFYAFSATAGQRLTLDLPVRPADYELHLYRPNGTFFNAYGAGGVWSYPAQVTIDATGLWAVAVRMPNLARTTDTYQLLVSDGTCSANDPWEPNNATAQAAALGAPGRVRATLCAANEVDAYSFSAAAGQRLTINYPANAAGATLRLLDANATELGRVQPGAQGNFTLAAGGSYTLVAANSSLAGSNVAYMFQWLLDGPQPAADSYVYYSDGLAGQLYRVALSPDHTVEPIFLSPSLTLSGEAVTADRVRGRLFSYNSYHGGDGFIARNGVDPFNGGDYMVVVSSPNPDGVAAPPIALAVDELTGRIYWVQPQGGSASLGSTIRSAAGDGSNNVEIVGAGLSRSSLVVDSVQGHLYWTEDGAIKRSNLDGSNVQTIRAAVPGQQVRDLALDPLAARLYWIDPTQNALLRANADGSG